MSDNNRNTRMYLVIAAFVAVVLLVAGVAVTVAVVTGNGGATLGAVTGEQGKDSGVQACENLAAAADQPQGEDESLTPQQWQQLREMFTGSRHPEIAEPGADVVALAREIDDMGQDAGLEVLPLVGQFQQAYARLRGGCADQGVDIPSFDELADQPDADTTA